MDRLEVLNSLWESYHEDDVSVVFTHFTKSFESKIAKGAALLVYQRATMRLDNRHLKKDAEKVDLSVVLCIEYGICGNATLTDLRKAEADVPDAFKLIALPEPPVEKPRRVDGKFINYFNFESDLSNV
jgi:hypothetical protein